MWSYLLIGFIIVSGGGLFGLVCLNFKTLEIEIEGIKDELNKKPVLSDAEREWLSIADRYIWEQKYKNCKVK